MSYTFVKCRPHPKCKKLVGWYLLLKSEDVETFERLHTRVTSDAYVRYAKDPHLFDQKTRMPKNGLALILNPFNVGAGWCETANRLLMEDGCILVNRVGGLMPMVPKEQIIKQIQSGDLCWPESSIKGEVINISQWTGGTHFYLSSNKKRIFVPEKFDTFDEAWEHAKNFVSEDKISFKKSKGGSTCP